MSTFEGNDSSLVFSVETPIHSEQLVLVESEFEEFRKNKSSRWERMFFRYYQYVTSGPYGSLVFNFDDAVLTLSDEEQKQIEETMNELMMATDWFSNWTSFYSIEQDLGVLSKEEIVNEKLIETYVESLTCPHFPYHSKSRKSGLKVNRSRCG